MPRGEKPGRLHAAALALADLGWRVHPLEPRGKRPLLTAWPERATVDAGVIREWWAEHPDANVGIATGVGSGLVVLDVDGEDGYASLARILSPLPPTLKVRTGRGEHWYYRHPGGHVANAAAIEGRAGLDRRGDGGYVVGPGSVHPDGSRYSLVQRVSRVELAALAAALPLAPIIILGAGSRESSCSSPPPARDSLPLAISWGHRQ